MTSPGFALGVGNNSSTIPFAVDTPPANPVRPSKRFYGVNPPRLSMGESFHSKKFYILLSDPASASAVSSKA